ncbi:unnamed protein product [Tilletia controversa]|uniref:HhH-GPD domain-containing protein n=2 Tax=Tilletia TaxID=13289 RepID=A0A177VHK2_9BASI|nr:hypothetical protein CF336_g245 [Tilletia laevis]KAE8265559.1 hypothetical protein A4X03_0g184 [Tilletia caries]CAD6901923.1 unnamed protein product [Tilletia controversa]KAE8208862.1 hypothetical protein CF335_g100 [Tilletia laevis]CAD6888538.1 unnamed protein product [Tilletia caries]
MEATRRSSRKRTAEDILPTPSPSPTKPQTRKRQSRSAGTDDTKVKQESTSTSERKPKKAKVESTNSPKSEPSVSPSKPKSTAALADRKLAALRTSLQQGPFPDWPLPTSEDAERVAWILGDFHGFSRPAGGSGADGLPKFVKREDKIKREQEKGERYGGCGDVPNVLDATVRTILSCNTSSRNSTAAHRSLVERYGKHNWQAVLDAPYEEVVETLRHGGLANTKARTIQNLLRDTKERYGALSLDHLHDAPDAEVMEQLVAFKGVGPKVASCVLMFCCGSVDSMAVDTHVFRLCKALGWVPEKANRDQTFYHLHERVPKEYKYPLHVLLIRHGRTCNNCSASGFATIKEEAKDEGTELKVKVEDLEAEDEDEEVRKAAEEEKKGKANRPCPLREAGLFGRKVTAQMKKEHAEKDSVKTE